MNIYGIGIDIISNERIKKAIKKNKKVINRIFSNNEIKKCNKTKNRINCLSKKYATKEAFVKAMGTGFSKGLSFNEITVLNDQNGKPTINLSKNILKVVNKILKTKNYKIFVSISDEKIISIATVLITKWIKNFI